MDKRFNEIYELYNNDLYKLVYSYLLNRYDSEDIVQRVFIKLFRNEKKLSLKNDDIKKWLFRVGINEAKDLLKSPFKKIFSNYELEDISITKNIENDLLADSLKRISPNYRIPLYLYYYEGYKIKEIAILLKKTESSIKMSIKREKEKLKQEMGDYNE